MCANVWKTAVTVLSVFQITQAWDIWIYKDTADNYQKFSYKDAGQICTCENFNPDLESLVFSHGYRSSCDKENPKIFIDTLLTTGSRNVFCVDWSSEANSNLIGVDYIFFPQKVANELALGLSYMTCLDPLKLQLVGMSMGAQIVGESGRQYFKLTGKPIDQVVGLDPAKLLYDEPVKIFTGIDKDSAKFVKTIYTDPNKYGASTQLGHVIFCPDRNTYLESGHQPGCPVTLPFPLYTFTKDDTCNHARALRLLTDEYRYPGQLIGVKSPSMEYWLAGLVDPNEINGMGENTNRQCTGTFYLHTNPESPFGLGMEGITPVLQ